MSKIIYVLGRENLNQDMEAKLKAICGRLEPDNLSLPVQHKVHVNNTCAYGIINHRSSKTKGDSVLLGCLYGQGRSWDEPGTPYPDGSYALFRNNEEYLEVVSDAAGSRTIWYYCDRDKFISSTSQRAIIMFLGTFEFDDRVLPWMMSTGSIGPTFSWDKRIKRIPPESSVLLDKQAWSLSVRQEPVVFSVKDRSRSDYKELLTEDIRKTIQSLRTSDSINLRDWALPLSGGYDSRGILCFLGENGRPPEGMKTITWGLKDSLARKNNDAAVAEELAKKVGVEHKYCHTDLSTEPVEKVIDRFLKCGEGRSDGLSAYMDGLEIWRMLLEDEKLSGIIRGDEGFGWVPVSSELTVRLSVGCGLCSDFQNLDGVIEKFNLPRQDYPAELLRKAGESLDAWRDRLYHSFRLPTVLAALSDVKYSYVEVINPLLSRSILHRVRELPERARTNKALFREIVDHVSPDVRHATEGANADPADILGKKPVVELMRKTLQSERSAQVLGKSFLEHIARGARHESDSKKQGSRGIKSTIKSLVPRFLKNWIRDRIAKPSVDGNALAFRVFMTLRMHEILSSDSVACR